MIIGIDASRANLDHKSGTEWYSYYLIRWLSKLDDKNEYILYTDKLLKGGLLDLTTEQYFEGEGQFNEIKFDKNGYQIIKSKFNNFKAKILKWPFDFFWTQGRLSLEMLLHRPDVLFVPAHTLPVIHPKKSIVTIHDIGYERQNCLYGGNEIGPDNKKAKRLLNFLVGLFTFGKYQANSVDYLKWSTEYALRKADRIITISSFSKEDLKNYYKFDYKKIRVVHNGYNKFLYKHINDPEKIKVIMEKYDIEGPYILYIGRIERKKNISALVEAFAILRENNKGLSHRLVLVGDASFGFDEIKYMIREFDLVNEIILPGWVDEVDVPYLFNGASAFVFPSNYEGFGIPLLQAMACGVPIAASNKTSIPEVVGDAALLFNPDYSLSIADALRDIIKDQKIREKLIANGFERIKQFSWEETAKKTLDIISYKP
jgi:glycosyltransferase involved in cell wall biosynthesis